MRIGVGFRAAYCAGALLALISFANADENAPAAATPEPSASVVAANTEVHLRLLEPVASNTHKHGDHFALEVVDPVLVNGNLLIPAGAQGEGEVVHAAKGGFGGKAGELILVSRFVRVGDQVVKLRSFSVGNGKDRGDLAFGLSLVLVGLFVTGQNIVLPAGTDVFAKVAEDSLLPALSVAQPQTAESNPSSNADQHSTEIDKNETSPH